MDKDDHIYVEHILESIEKIEKYTEDLSKEDFAKQEMIQDAVIRNLEIIGEATKMISISMKQSYQNIPWKEIAGMRDKLIHDYIGVDISVVWKTIEHDLPELKKMINEIKA